MRRSFKYIMIMAAILVIAAIAVAACGGDDDGGDSAGNPTATAGGASPTATASSPSVSTGSQTPTIAPDPSGYCSDEAVETLFQSIKLAAEDRGLSVSSEENLRKDARTTLDHLCLASTPFQIPALQTYCEDLIQAVESNVEGDDTAKEQLKDHYRVASCPTPAPSPG